MAYENATKTVSMRLDDSLSGNFSILVTLEDMMDSSTTQEFFFIFEQPNFINNQGNTVADEESP